MCAALTSESPCASQVSEVAHLLRTTCGYFEKLKVRSSPAHPSLPNTFSLLCRCHLAICSCDPPSAPDSASSSVWGRDSPLFPAPPAPRPQSPTPPPTTPTTTPPALSPNRMGTHHASEGGRCFAGSRGGTMRRRTPSASSPSRRLRSPLARRRGSHTSRLRRLRSATLHQLPLRRRL